MKNKQPTPEVKYRIRFMTADGSLIMTRPCGDWVAKDKEFLAYSTAIDARERGVRIVSSEWVRTASELIYSCVVAYL